MLLYPKLEKLSTQRGVAKLLLLLFSAIAFVGFIFIILKYYFISTNHIGDYFISSKIDLTKLDDLYKGAIPYKGSIKIPFSFTDTYFINLYIQCFSGILIVVAWLSLIKETQKIGGDPNWGLAWLAFAIMYWCIGDLINIFIEFHDAIGHKNDLHQFDQPIRKTLGRVTSTFNSFCFLYSLRYLEFKDNSKWKKLRDRIEEYHSIALVALLLTSLVIITVILGITFDNSNSVLVYIPDLVVSVVTTLALWIFFIEYFSQRDIKYMKFLVSVVVLVIVIVQISHVFEQHQLQLLYIKKGAPILSMVYRPLLMMLFLLMAFSSLRNEKEKQAILERRDMNHAIRGSLHILNKDVERLIKKEKSQQHYENIFALQDLGFRTKLILDLHNLIHNEYGDAKINLENYLKLLIENAKYAFDYTNLSFSFVKVESIYIERSLIRKIGTVLAELITNSAKAAIRKSNNTSYPNFNLTDKLLYINVVNRDILLKITVGDNGVFSNDILYKTTTGHGLSLIKRTILEDFEGKLSSNRSEYGGTEICIEIPLSNII